MSFWLFDVFNQEPTSSKSVRKRTTRSTQRMTLSLSMLRPIFMSKQHGHFSNCGFALELFENHCCQSWLAWCSLVLIGLALSLPLQFMQDVPTFFFFFSNNEQGKSYEIRFIPSIQQDQASQHADDAPKVNSCESSKQLVQQRKMRKSMLF